MVSSHSFDGFIFEKIEQTKKAKARAAVSYSWKIYQCLASNNCFFVVSGFHGNFFKG